jgi:hypothetical protein
MKRFEGIMTIFNKYDGGIIGKALAVSSGTRTCDEWKVL